jgi:hypothetical protein
MFLPFFLSIVFLVIVLAAPLVFKMIFKNESFFGYCIGICCYIITGIILLIIFLIETIALAAYITKKYDNIQDVDYSSINSLKNLSFGIRFVVWLLDAIEFVSRFLVLYFYLNKVAQPEHPCNTVFMFLSGYNIFNISGFIIVALLSIGAEFIEKYADKRIDESGHVIAGYTTWFLMKMCFEQWAKIFLMTGTILLVFLYRKQLSNITIWIAVACFFGPLFFEFLGLVTKVEFIYSTLTKFSYLVALVLGSFFYFKLANQTASPGAGETYTAAP